MAGAEDTQAKTIVVTSTADNGPRTLRNALAIAANGDTINITANGTITLTSGELVVDKSITIRGPGPHGTISGNNTTRVFHIMPGTVVALDSLTITNGRVSNNRADNFPLNVGGGIYSDHATLTLTNCTVVGNSAVIGGGIFSNSMDGGSASLTINNSMITNNSAESSDHIASYGGAIFSGGGFYNTGPAGNATLVINNSTISGNSAELIAGGILNDGFAGVATLVVNNSTISNNTSYHPFSVYQFGGGIYNNGDSGIATATLTDSVITQNSAGSFGGGIVNDGSNSIAVGHANLNLKNCTVTKNSARIPNVEFGGQGGGIFSLGNQGISKVTLNNCAFTENSAGPGDGGAVYVQNDDGSSPTSLLITGCTINYNSAETGGGIEIFNTNAVITNTTIAGNSAPGGGGIAIDQGLGNPGSSRLELTNCVVSNNRAVGEIDLPDFVILYGGGGGILNTGFALTLRNCTLSGNYAVGAGGGIFNECVFDNNSVIIENSTISGNFTVSDRAVGEGGGIFNGGLGGFGASLTATIYLIDSTLSGNSADVGGGIHNQSFGFGDDGRGTGAVIIRNSTLSGNSAGFGGGIFSWGSTAEFGTATVDLGNTIVNAGSSGENFVAYEDGTITSQGYNLSSDAAGGNNTTGPGGLLNRPGDIRNTNPLLGPLQDNGGPTLTHLPQLHSPAIDAGNPNFSPYAFNPPLLYDQRGGPHYPRIINGRVDIGSVETNYRRP